MYSVPGSNAACSSFVVIVTTLPPPPLMDSNICWAIKLYPLKNTCKLRCSFCKGNPFLHTHFSIFSRRGYGAQWHREVPATWWGGLKLTERSPSFGGECCGFLQHTKTPHMVPLTWRGVVKISKISTPHLVPTKHKKLPATSRGVLVGSRSPLGVSGWRGVFRFRGEVPAYCLRFTYP